MDVPLFFVPGCVEPFFTPVSADTTVRTKTSLINMTQSGCTIMFIGHTSFEHRTGFGDGVTYWTAVEVAPLMPWFIATYRDDVHMEMREVLFSGGCDLNEVVVGSPFGQLTELSMIKAADPVKSLGTEHIRFVRIERVRAMNPRDPDSIVLTSTNGRQYSGYPVISINIEQALLEPVMELLG
jgi:hypothetical protein